MRNFKISVVLLAILLLANGCDSFEIVRNYLPASVPYPQGNEGDLNAEAQRISDELDAFVQEWLAGNNDGVIPESLLPQGANVAVDWGTVRLVKPEEVNPRDLWVIREAEDVDPNALLGFYPDPNCTYLVLNVFYAPFGHTAVMEGEFPYSRFFSVNTSPAFDPRNYYYDGTFGVPEVPMADVDMEPLPGNVNPFQPGASRQATNRSYQLRFELTAGDPVALEPAYSPPFLSPGNSRKASAIQYQGPLAQPGVAFGHGRGVWDDGEFWVRYYAPDNGQGPLAGVELPTVYYETPDGERYAVVAANSNKESRLNTSIPARMEPETAQPLDLYGQSYGWSQAMEIMQDGISAVYQTNRWNTPSQKQDGKELVLGYTSRGGDQPAPRNYVSSTSREPHIRYFVRNITLQEGYVAVLTGKLPRTPKTLSGEGTLTDGQLRYFSITSFITPDLLAGGISGYARTSIMDEEITVDGEGNYTIVYSRDRDRPQNATVENGVTWIDRGEEATQEHMIRMLNLPPNWLGGELSFDPLTYAATSWLSPEYDESLIGVNGQSVLGEYLPTVHYLPKAEFEAMNSNITLQAGNPVWK